MKNCRNCGIMMVDEQEYCPSCGTKYQVESNDMIDDITFIKAIKYTKFEVWNQYDVLLATQIYGWELMKDWAEYMSKNDLDLSKNGQITVGSIGGGGEKDIIDSYKKCDSILNMAELEYEHGSLSIAGISNALKVPTKIVWLNQTSALRIFTLEKFDEETMRRYIETAVRRTFGTPDEMKLAKPLPQNPNKGNDASVSPNYSTEFSDKNSVDTDKKTKFSRLLKIGISVLIILVFLVVGIVQIVQDVEKRIKQEEYEKFQQVQKAIEDQKAYEKEYIEYIKEQQKKMPSSEELEKIINELQENEKGK